MCTSRMLEGEWKARHGGIHLEFSTQEERQKYLCKFEDSQGYTVRPHLKEKKKKEIKERRKEQAKHGGSTTNPSTQKSGRL